MDDLEAGALVQVERTDLPHVPCSSLGLRVKNDTVGDFEDFLWDGVLLVELEALKQTWHQSSSYNFELNRLWVRQRDTLAVVYFLSHVQVVVLEREESKVETFNVACLGQFVSKVIGHLVVGLE